MIQVLVVLAANWALEEPSAQGRAGGWILNEAEDLFEH